MGKRRKKIKSQRPYATTSVPSKYKEFFEQEKAKEKEKQEAVVEPAPVPAPEQTEEDVELALDSNNERLTEWVVSNGQQAVETAMQKAKKQIRAMDFSAKDLDAILRFPREVDESVMDLCKNLGVVDQDEETPSKTEAAWLKVNRENIESLLLSNFIVLEQIGFPEDAIVQGLERHAHRLDETIDWLALHMSDELLPSGWARENLDLDKPPEPKSVPLETTDEPQPEKTNKPVKQTTPTKKQEEGSSPSQAEIIARLVAMQEEEYIQEQAMMNEDPRDRYTRLLTQVDDLISQAAKLKKSKDKAEKDAISSSIRAVRNEMDQLCKQYPEFRKIQLEKPTTVENVEEQVDASLDDDEAEEGGLGGLFAGFEESDESSTATPSSTRSNIQYIDLSSSKKKKREPSTLLFQHVKKSCGKSTDIKYKTSKLYLGTYNATVTFAGKSFSMDEKEACRSEDMAKEYIALKALYDIANDRAYHQQMSDTCQTIWKTWVQKEKQERLDAERKERLNKARLVDSIVKKCLAEDSDMRKSAAGSTVATSEASVEENIKYPSQVSLKFLGSVEDNVKELNEKHASESYQQYAVERQSLPIMKIHDELMNAIENNDVVIVSGQTGSGKTTQIPARIYEYCTLKLNSPCRIVCTEPRRISTISVAERVAVEFNDDFGIVGYQIRGDKRGKNSKVLYSTTGVVLRQLKSDPLLLRFSHVVIDEVHERTVDSDFLLAILKQVVNKRAGGVTVNGVDFPPLRVVLMSATIDLDKLSKYFDGAPCLSAGGRTFPVEVFDLEDCCQLTSYKLDEPYYSVTHSYRYYNFSQRQFADFEKSQATLQSELETGGYNKNTIATVLDLDDRKVNYDLIERLLVMIVVKQHDPSGPCGPKFDNALQTLESAGDRDSNAVLVFLPGLAQITQLYDRITHHSVLGRGRLMVLRLHSSLSSLKSEQKKLFSKAPHGVQKVVLSTNIAETGVTIPDVAFVIDSGRVKEIGFNPSRQMQSLDEVFASESNLVQRSGRAGRVRPGISFRLLTKRGQGKLKPYPLPEIQRVPLHSVCLHILSMLQSNINHITSSIRNPWDFLANALDPPKPSAIDAAVETLEQIGAVKGLPLDSDIADARPVLELLTLGKHLSVFPLDIKIGKMLIYGSIFKCLDPILTVAAAVNVMDKVFVNSSDKHAGEMQRVFRHEYSDLLTIYNCYRRFAVEKQRGGHRGLDGFCKKYCVSKKSLMEIEKTKKELLEYMKDMGFVSKGFQYLDKYVVETGGKKQEMVIKYLPDDELNTYSTEDEIVTATLCGGLYPNVAKVVPGKQLTYLCKGKQLNQEEQVGLVNRSVNSKKSVGFSSDEGINRFRSGWVVYLTKMKTTRTLLWDSTFVPPLALVLFGGSVKISHQNRTIRVDDWISFHVNPKTATLLKKLRVGLNNYLEVKLDKPTEVVPFGDELIQTVSQMLKHTC